MIEVTTSFQVEQTTYIPRVSLDHLDDSTWLIWATSAQKYLVLLRRRPWMLPRGQVLQHIQANSCAA